MQVADLGNTRIHVASAKDGAIGRMRSLDYAALPRLKLSGTVVYAGVNPPQERRFEKRFRALKVGRDLPLPIRNRTRQPAKVGADRLANAVAAWARTRRTCVVIDLGTAITFDVVDRRGNFVGGLIAPGLSLQARALHEHTAQLPLVSPRAIRRGVGRDTGEAIAAALHAAVTGLIREGIARIARDLGTRPRVIATGGDAPFFRDLVDDLVPGLTLEGVAIAAWRHGLK